MRTTFVLFVVFILSPNSSPFADQINLVSGCLYHYFVHFCARVFFLVSLHPLGWEEKTKFDLPLYNYLPLCINFYWLMRCLLCASKTEFDSLNKRSFFRSLDGGHIVFFFGINGGPRPSKTSLFRV